MHQKNGRVEIGVTRTEDGKPCTGVRKDGEPVAKNEERGSLQKLKTAMINQSSKLSVDEP